VEIFEIIRFFYRIFKNDFLYLYHTIARDMKNFDYSLGFNITQHIVRKPFKPERYYSSDKPKQCPRCKSVIIAELFYGEPGRSTELFADLKAGRLIPAGRTMREDTPNPRWKCLDCQTEIYQKES